MEEADVALHLKLIPGLLLLVMAAAFAACGDDDDDGGPPAGTTAPAVTSGSTETVPPGAETPTSAGSDTVGDPAPGQALVSVDGEETVLTVDECLFEGPLSDVTIEATEEGGDALLRIAGLGEVATIQFQRAGEQWLAPAVDLGGDPAALGYQGAATKSGDSPSAAQIALKVNCT
jgi:hypothetical protein